MSFQCSVGAVVEDDGQFSDLNLGLEVARHHFWAVLVSVLVVAVAALKSTLVLESTGLGRSVGLEKNSLAHVTGYS